MQLNRWCPQRGDTGRGHKWTSWVCGYGDGSWCALTWWARLCTGADLAGYCPPVVSVWQLAWTCSPTPACSPLSHLCHTQDTADHKVLPPKQEVTCSLSLLHLISATSCKPHAYVLGQGADIRWQLILSLALSDSTLAAGFQLTPWCATCSCISSKTWTKI